MNLPVAALLISLLALILTKVADIVTTLRGIRRSGGSVQWEQNPLARKAMLRWGPLSGIAAVMVLWSLIIFACYAPAFFAPAWYQIATAVGGFAIAWCQWDVARMNATGRHSWFSRLASRSYQTWQNLAGPK